MPGKFEIKKATHGQFYFNLKSPNGEVILTSEMYKARTGATKGIASVQANAGTAARFEKKVTKAGKPYFVLKAANHQVIGQSESYSTEAARDKGIAAVGKVAGAANIADLTKA
ncbi:MAG: YegP family protein [Acidobacteria bacterium]|nr:YegP family protein [Acidobacteriota bacterium]